MSYSFGFIQRPSSFLQGRRFFFFLVTLFFLGTHVSGYGTGKGHSDFEITVESIEGVTDTIEFHIGSPLFLRLNINAGRACEPFNGRPFYFAEAGAQLGWGFQEVSDSLLFPRRKNACERIVMLSSENSNLLAEGYYTLSIALLIDEKSELRSDTIVLHPVHAAGANKLSYSRFLLEQMLSNSPLLRDPLTLKELFAPHLPHSPASEVYHAAILYTNGQYEGAVQALATAQQLQDESGGNISYAANLLRGELQRRLEEASN